MSRIITPAKRLEGTISVPGDKSLTHRAIMLAALSDNDTKISRFLRCSDTISTISCVQKLGISVEDLGNQEILVHGKGLYGLNYPTTILDVKNSGTTARLLTGILSAQPFHSEIRGDDSLNRTPMGRILKPLSLMGAEIKSSGRTHSTPLHIQGRELYGINYQIPLASSQVKSAILFAALYAKGSTTIIEPYYTRNHTEMLMQMFGVDVDVYGTMITLNPPERLISQDLRIPGDLSSASFLIAAALITEGSEITLKDVGVNSSNIGFINLLKEMNADISLHYKENGKIDVADITVKSSQLRGITIKKDMIPSIIDEIPILTVLACFAKGNTIIKNARELRLKETDRIEALAENLGRMGANITPTKDGMIVKGVGKLHGAIVGSRLDHRIAMSLAIAGTCCEGSTEIIGSECVNVSYPNFYNDLETLVVK